MKHALVFMLLCMLGCKNESFEPMMESKDVGRESSMDVAAKDELAGAADQTMTRERKIIRSASLQIVVQSHDQTMTEIHKTAKQFGGFISNMSTDLAYQSIKRTDVTLRVPAAVFDSALASIRHLAASIEHESVQGQDVTEEFVDIEARLGNRRAEEKQLLQVLQRSGTVHDILEVQRELFRVREEIERVEGRQKFLAAQVNLATIAIHFHEPYPSTIGRHGGFWSTLAQGFENGFYGFANVLGGTITFLIAGIPIFVVFGFLGWIIVRLVRRRKA